METASMTEITISYILIEVSKTIKIPVDAFLTKDRLIDHVTARQVSMTLAYEFTGKSYETIGKAIGNRDHSTVYHARQKVQSLLDVKDPRIMNVYPALLHKLQKIKSELTDRDEKYINNLFNTEK